jgi:hypothetical protein
MASGYLNQVRIFELAKVTTYGKYPFHNIDKLVRSRNTPVSVVPAKLVLDLIG